MANTLFVVGSDSSLKEVSNSQLVNTYDAGCALSCVALPRKTRALFAGTADSEAPGQLRSYTFPLTGEYLRYHCHAGKRLKANNVTPQSIYWLLPGERWLSGRTHVAPPKEDTPSRMSRPRPRTFGPSERARLAAREGETVKDGCHVVYLSSGRYVRSDKASCIDNPLSAATEKLVTRCACRPGLARLLADVSDATQYADSVRQLRSSQRCRVGQSVIRAVWPAR